MIRMLSILIPLVVLSCSLPAQHLLFENLTTEHGLSQNAVLSICQDYRGFMWYGTQNGLNRYDARRFKTYSSNPSDSSSLSSGYVTCLLEDRQHRLWVGTRNGLNRYCPEMDNFIRPALPTQSAGNVSCIYEDRQGNIWAWTSAGLFKMGATAGSVFTHVPVPDSIAGLSGNNVRTIYQDHTGTYWLGSSAGLTALTKDNRFTIYRHAADPATLSDNYVTCITEDRHQRLWIGTLHGGVNLFLRETGTFSRFTASGGTTGPVDNNIRQLRTDGTGNIWIGTLGGLSILDPEQQHFSHYRHDQEDKSSLSHNSIYSIFIDRPGTIWIGTYWGGINSVSPQGAPFHAYRTEKYHPSINNNVVSAIWEDQGHFLWIGTEGSGLHYLDRSKDLVTSYRHQANDPSSLGSNLIKVVYGDRQGNIWIGTHGGGLNLFNPTRKNFTRFFYKENDAVTLGAEVLCLLEDDERNFWIGTQRGLLAYKKNNTHLQEALMLPALQQIGNVAIKTLLQARNKTIWAGTSAGLYSISHSGKKVRAHKLPDGLITADVNCLYEDRNGQIWAGLYYQGVLRFNPAESDSFRLFRENDGLSNNNVTAIQGDGDMLWISTSNGLSRLNTTTGEFKSYYKEDGLRNNTFNLNSSFKARDGQLLFGGFNGLTSFYPSQIAGNTWLPPTVITSLKVFNQTIGIAGEDGILKQNISLTDRITFTHKQNVFTLEFAGLSYILPGKNRYAYKLTGFDADWTFTSTPSVTYMNLSPGQYTFRAKSTNNDGVWGPETTLRITVLPPFWKTIWAYLLYIVVAATLIFFIIRYFILRALLKSDKKLMQFKLSFFTNISHEIRTHLSLIHGPVEEMVRTGTGNDHMTGQLQTVKKNSESLLQLVTELMDFRRAETGHLVLHVTPGNIVHFLRNAYTSFNTLSASKNISVNLVTSDEDIRLYFDHAQLEKVFYNLLSNALKFTPVGGHVGITVEDSRERVAITFTDNGKGIAPGNLDNLFKNYFQESDHSQNTGYGIGLALAKSIIEIHKGSITAESYQGPPGNKTSFRVTLLKGTAHFPPEWVSEEEDTAVFAIRQQEATAEIPEVPHTLPDDTPGQTVLLVEDNDGIRAFIRRSLGGYNIIESTNGRLGLEMALAHLPDIIISDVMMPEMDGLQLCHEIKSADATAHIPVILLTAMTTQAEQITGLKTGADIYLTKPFSMEVLQLQVNNLMQLRTRMQQWVKNRLSTPPADASAPALNLEDEFLQKLVGIIEGNMDEPGFGVLTLSQMANMSHPVLYKKLDVLTGMSVNDFIKAVRLRKAAELLKTKKHTIAEVAYMTGFSDRKYFSKEFKKSFGKAPREFIDGIEA